MSLWLLIMLGLLLALGGVSIYIAKSGVAQVEPIIGWVFLAIYLAIYFPFINRFLDEVPIVTWHHLLPAIAALAVSVLLLLANWPLLTQLVTQLIMRDRSGGVRILKSYGHIEKMASEGDLLGAIEGYEEAIADDPRDIAARFRLAELCDSTKNFPKSVLAYEGILEQSKRLSVSQHCSALTKLSEIHLHHIGDHEEAKKYIQIIIDTYPDTEYAKYAKDRLANF